MPGCHHADAATLAHQMKRNLGAGPGLTRARRALNDERGLIEPCDEISQSGGFDVSVLERLAGFDAGDGRRGAAKHVQGRGEASVAVDDGCRYAPERCLLLAGSVRLARCEGSR